jgi:hypothetical protein
LKSLEADIAATLVRADGTIGKSKFDLFERASILEQGELDSLNFQYAFYSEGLPVSDLVFDGDEPTRQTRHPVFEAAVWYDPVARTLDVVAAGGPQFTLDRLKRHFTGETDASDGIQSVKVFLVSLAPTDGSYGRVTVETGRTDQIDICERSKRWFGDADPLQRPGWHITQAKLCIMFHPEVSRTKGKTVTLELDTPNGSNIREPIGRMVDRRPQIDQTRLASLVHSLPGKFGFVSGAIKTTRKNRREPARRDYRHADRPLVDEMRAMILAGKARDPTNAALVHERPGLGVCQPGWRLADSNGGRHGDTRHPIQHVASNLCLGPLRRQSPGLKSSVNDGLVPIDRSFNQAPTIIPRMALASPCVHAFRSLQCADRAASS